MYKPNEDDPDFNQISQPLSKATLQLMQAALHLESAQQALSRAMRLSDEYAGALYFEPGRIQAMIEAIKREIREVRS